MGFEDHFSTESGGYATFRPTYPAALYTALAARVPGAKRAWEVGCGSGQATPGLAGIAEEVVATEPSAAQLALAPAIPGVRYLQASAEASGLEAGSVDLLLAAQCAHWFDLPRFDAEVRRVLRSGGLVALVGYRLVDIDPAVDAVVAWYADERVGRWWPEGRRILDGRYAALNLSLPEEPPLEVEMTARWSLDHLLGYLGTWSSTKRCRAGEGVDPIPEVVARLAPIWGERTRVRTVRWPLINRVFRVP